MENKLYLIREMYDSLSYKLYDEFYNFLESDNNLLIGCRRSGKTTIAIIDALSEGLTNDNIYIGFYTDNGTNRIKMDLLKIKCDEFGIDYSIDTFNNRIILANGAIIQILSKNQVRGRRFDYVISDVNTITESEYDYVFSVSRGHFRIIIGVQNNFTYQYKKNNPDKVFTLAWNNLVSGEW